MYCIINFNKTLSTEHQLQSSTTGCIVNESARLSNPLPTSTHQANQHMATEQQTPPVNLQTSVNQQSTATIRKSNNVHDK